MDEVGDKAREILTRIADAFSEADRQGMARFGIVSAKARVFVRQIGKRNAILREAAMDTARRLIARNDKTARWIGRDALKEPESKT